MKISNYNDIPSHSLMLPGAKGASIRVLIGADDGAPNFVMLMITLAPGGNTPEHSHEWEEEIFVKSGEGLVRTEKGERPLRGGDVLYLDPNLPHQFLNSGEEPMEFLCVIPRRD